ncbi:hypothetical protein D5F53_06750 [Paenibacillus lautus]|uniref:Uncharacterized protein n=1 Tax=Paenibacillus lautus TaxID=1401 RepID=A0A385TH52_PAELA|nr:hypothetical protein D5F53_06750 [Paenibacillus lautus]
MKRYPPDFDGETVKGFPEDLIFTTHVCRGNYHSTWASSGGCGRFGIRNQIIALHISPWEVTEKDSDNPLRGFFSGST